MKRIDIYKQTDIAPLAVFRIFFGLLLALETYGAIFTGWVRTNLVEPTFTFSYIGLEWLQPLPGDGMYYYFAVMGTLGLLVMIGYRYRPSLCLFTILWAGSYLMQKSSYNNHYYLLLLVCILMLCVPANRYASVDARRNPAIRSVSMPVWCIDIMILQISIVYLFAVVSKMYAGWLDGTFTRIMLEYCEFYPYFQTLFSKHWFHLFLAWSGILFDLLVVPMLLFKRTRMFALIASVVFHLFNAVFLQIGIFPFFALSFALFFYPPHVIRHVFFRNRVPYEINGKPDRNNGLLYFFLLPYFIIQLALPLRHYFIEGDVLWTEEGHRLSWRMMLRQKSGDLTFHVVDKQTNELLPYNLRNSLTEKQLSFVQTKPDGIWQMAQRIRKEYAEKGRDVEVYADSYLSVNESEFERFVDPDTDLAKAQWNYFGHSDWIILRPDREVK